MSRFEDDEEEDTTIYRVVIVRDYQYTLFPADREIPRGVQDTGMKGTKQECVAFIDKKLAERR